MKPIDTRAKAGLIALLLAFAFGTLSLQLMRPPKALDATAAAADFSAARAMQHLKIVAKQPHSLGTPANDEVIEYTVQELKKLGLSVQMQDTLVSRSFEKGFSTRICRVKNIIGTLQGTANSKAVLLMAHHDSQPNTPGAADDGSGVVAILETVRALKESGPLKNDLMVLITDAEEIGLMGARAFVQYHPLLAEVGVVINIEARGNRGVSMSFEMNPDNGWIAREFAKAAPYPFANSMAYEIYKVMPNDTDFSEFRETPVAGINSACVEGFVNYHSMTDTPENISQNLLQHHGSNMLGMAKHFANMEITHTKAPDAIFFNTLGSHLVIYPAQLNWLFIILALALFILTIIIGIQKQKVNLSHLLTGTGYFLVILVISGIGSYLLQQAILAINPHYTLFYANNFYNVEYYFFAFIGLAALFYAIIFGFRPEMSGLSLSLGGVLMLIMALFGLTLSLPTGTYLLYIPLIFYLLVQLGLLFFNVEEIENAYAYGIGQFVALVPALSLWVPLIYLLSVTFGLTVAVIAPVLVFCFLAILAIPIVRMISLWSKRILITVSVLFILFGLLAGQLTSKPSATQPLQTYLIYGVDKAVKDKATWATNKRYKNDWVKRIIPSEEAAPFSEVYPNWKWNLWKAEAPRKKVSSSQINVLQDTVLADKQRIIELFVEFEALVNSMEFFIKEGNKLVEITLNGHPIQPLANPQSQLTYFNFFAPPKEGFKLSIKTKSPKLDLQTIDRIIGLPTDLFPSPMPNDMIHGPGSRSNVTLVKQDYRF